MPVIVRKLTSALRIARQDGWRGLVRAAGRNAGIAALQAQLDEVDIVADFFRAVGGQGVMFDVGAHFGGSLRPFAYRGWQIHAFEPDASNRAQLQAEFGATQNVRIDPRAVAAEVRYGVSFYRSEQSTGISSLSAFSDTHHEAGTIDVTTLSEVIHDRGVEHIEFLKIDTEGHDLFVLRGLPWDRLTPRVILCEFENKKSEPLGYGYQDLVQILFDHGYAVIVSEWHPIVRYGVAHRWRRFVEGQPPELADPAGWGNLLAVRDGSDLVPLRAACERAAARERALH